MIKKYKDNNCFNNYNANISLDFNIYKPIKTS